MTTLNTRVSPVLLAGTRDDGNDEARAWLATDWLVRVQAPAWLRLLGRDDLADALEHCAPLRSAETARGAQPILDDARRVAWAAADAAAWGAARGAARDAAWTVARAAAWNSAGAAVWAAAWVFRDVALESARDAARDIAWDAAQAAALEAAKTVTAPEAWPAAATERLRPTLASLQESALGLFARMIDPQEVGA